MILSSQKVTICLVKGAVVSKRIRNIALAKQKDKLSAYPGASLCRIETVKCVTNNEVSMYILFARACTMSAALKLYKNVEELAINS